MSAEFSSSNPFRRNDSINTPPPNPSLANHIVYHQTNSQQSLGEFEPFDVHKKITKKVRVQSPPPLSPSIPSTSDSASTIGDDDHSTYVRTPTSPLSRDGDPFDSFNPRIDKDDGFRRPSGAPANPFSKTLETMEQGRDRPMIPPANVTSPGRASMDVDAFKRLLMTGSSGLALPVGQPSQSQGVHSMGDGGSSTDASSLSRQSIFEAIQEPHPESPRTSHEISEPEDERSKYSAEGLYSLSRRAPPPPSSKHGKMIKVELRDEPSSAATSNTNSLPIRGSSLTSGRPTSYYESNLSQTDLNKPLPPAPHRTSHDSERESVFDKESIGKTPEPPSPSSSVIRKTPPTPPITRRHSQMVSDSKLGRSNSGRLSPKVEEDMSNWEDTRPRSDISRFPPPPPSRRPGSIRVMSNNSPLNSPSAISLPTPPPPRGSSLAARRPPSVHSMDTSSPAPTKRSSYMPPPPPPPRTRRSMDGQSPINSRRTSGELPRQDVDGMRRGSAASAVLPEGVPDIGDSRGIREISMTDSHDILADLTKLQREIDELRLQSKRDKLKLSGT